MNSQSPSVSVVARPPQLHSVTCGAGRLLNTAYLAGGRLIGRRCNRLTHQLGHGPDAATERILKALKGKAGGLMRLPHLLTEVGGELDRNCLKLMKYALP